MRSRPRWGSRLAQAELLPYSSRSGGSDWPSVRSITPSVRRLTPNLTRRNAGSPSCTRKPSSIWAARKPPCASAGLYSLERVAQNNVELRQTIVNVVCAYLRMAQPEDAEEREVRLTAQRILAAHLR